MFPYANTLRKIREQMKTEIIEIECIDRVFIQQGIEFNSYRGIKCFEKIKETDNYNLASLIILLLRITLKSNIFLGLLLKLALNQKNLFSNRQNNPKLSTRIKAEIKMDRKKNNMKNVRLIST